MITCVCRCITDKQVMKAIDDGASSLRDLQRRGIGDQCGSCHNSLRMMLAAAPVQAHGRVWLTSHASRAVDYEARRRSSSMFFDMDRDATRELVLGLWKIHVLHHAVNDGVVGHHVLQELDRHGLRRRAPSRASIPE
jgi:bacterioferritin-associated ferredoxin